MGREIGLLAGAGVAAAAVMAYAVRSPSSSLLAPSVYRGPRDRARIALTFDDGPTPATLELLEILNEHSIPSTFFQCGAQVRRNPFIARAVREAGHEIGNHTDTHPYLSFKSPAFIRGEIGRAQRSIFDATGATCRWFRAPYGVRWFGLRTAQSEFQLTGAMWTVIGRDWALDAPAVADRVLRRAGNGAIVCLHDGRALEASPNVRSTLKAVRQIIPVLLDQGFEFDTMSELICPQT